MMLAFVVGNLAMLAWPGIAAQRHPIGVDELWLRYSLITDKAKLASYRAQLQRVVLTADTKTLSTSSAVSQLRSAANELATGLTGLTGRDVPSACCDSNETLQPGTLFVSVNSTAEFLGSEAFAIGRLGGAVTVTAATASGALYGSFRLLSYVQRGERIPQDEVSDPAMALRVWDLWDNLDGSIERGYAGNSIMWPMALYDDEHPPPRQLLYLADCNISDRYQQWEGKTLHQGQGEAVASPLRNRGSGWCLSSKQGDPVLATPCAEAGSAHETTWLFNESNMSIAVMHRDSDTDLSRPSLCLDINGGHGPDIDLWSCHGLDNQDWTHQQFHPERDTGFIRTPDDVGGGKCLTLNRSPPPPSGTTSPWSGRYKARFEHMMRFLKSAGFNGISLTNVNSCGNNAKLLKTDVLANVTRNLGPIMERWGITPYFSVCYASPHVLSNVTSDPLSPDAQQWWANKVEELYERLPNFGGFVVKADSEGSQGPQAFNRTEAQGANLLARALKPFGGVVMWRAFVYANLPEERAKQAYDTFVPIDGQFDTNVVVQIKHGPMDFQVREPVSPLFSGLRSTNMMMEVQATQEYTGQQIHVVGLTRAWQSYLDFDTRVHGAGATSTVASLLSGKPMGGMACISNFGDWANWTGHVLGASNAYGCGRLAWDPALPSSEIHREWAAMSFPEGDDLVVDTIVSILERSWEIYEGYTSPLGIGFMCAGCGGWPFYHNCAPSTKGPGPGPGGAECPWSERNGHGNIERSSGDHYWVDPCVNYHDANYSAFGLGCERTSIGGTGYASQYHPEVRDMFNNLDTCPTELLLFFHNLPWSHPMSLKDGSSVSLFQFIAQRHDNALTEARQSALDWDSLMGHMDVERFEAVQERFHQQLHDAAVFSYVIMGYYHNISGLSTETFV